MQTVGLSCKQQLFPKLLTVGSNFCVFELPKANISDTLHSVEFECTTSFTVRLAAFLVSHKTLTFTVCLT